LEEEAMAKSTTAMIKEFGAQVGALAGAAVRAEVMTGSEAISTRTDPLDVARWVKGAVCRLDEAVPAETAVAIMEACGTNCAAINHGVIERAVARRQEYRSEEEFLAVELKKPMAGTRLERRGDVLHQFYTPRSFGRGMRCYCALLKALPDDETVSPTYCHCGKAFVRTLWGAVLGRPVVVEMVSSALSGSSECEFTVAIA
jgi:hypothetical protein